MYMYIALNCIVNHNIDTSKTHTRYTGQAPLNKMHKQQL